MALLLIFMLNIATDIFRYFSDYIFGRQVEITEKQKQLLGIKDNGRYLVMLVIPPAKRSFRGVYCFQPVRHSVIPSFRHSVNILTTLMNNLNSFCLILFKFLPHLHHQTIHVWYEFRGQRVSIARVMGLFKSSYNVFAIVLQVHTL